MYTFISVDSNLYLDKPKIKITLKIATESDPQICNAIHIPDT